MPLMNKNYVSPAWIDNAAPPINDDELNAMSETLEGSQILVGNGAPTFSTPGKVGQRYADISTTPPTMYVASAGFPGQPIPKLQTREEVRDGGYLIAYDSNGEFKSGSNNASDVTVLVYDVTRSGDDTVFYVLFTCKSQGAIAYLLSASTTQVYYFDTYYLNVRDNDTGLYYASQGLAFRSPDAVIEAPTYPNRAAALQAAANPPAVWKPEADPNRNLAQPYSTGGSYAAGDYCIHDGWLYKALEATSGTWDGSKWEQAKYADDLSGHEADQNNPHNVTAAQTGAVSPPVLATVQETNTAVRDYYAGEYFFYEGQLYELKEAVAQGGDLLETGVSEPAVLGDGVTALRPKTGTVTIGTFWSGSGPYSQTVTVTGAAVTTKSKVDLTPTAAQLETLAADGVLSLTIENNGGTLTAWVVGTQPSAAMTVSCIVRETA